MMKVPDNLLPKLVDGACSLLAPQLSDEVVCSLSVSCSITMNNGGTYAASMMLDRHPVDRREAGNYSSDD